MSKSGHASFEQLLAHFDTVVAPAIESLLHKAVETKDADAIHSVSRINQLVSSAQSRLRDRISAPAGVPESKRVRRPSLPAARQPDESRR